MSKKIYAVADKVAEWCDYLTSGKKYEVIDTACGGFYFVDDDGDERYAIWHGSVHLSGGNWRRIEEDDAEPVTLRPGDYVLTADIKDEAEFIAVRDAFVAAGADHSWYGDNFKGYNFKELKNQECMGWAFDGGLDGWKKCYYPYFGKRQLTVAQVLGTDKPTFTPTPGWKLTRDGRKAYVGYVREDKVEKPLVGHIDGETFSSSWIVTGKQ